MQLREVIKAEKGHSYKIWEYDVFPSGKVSRRESVVSRADTKIRCKQFNMHHEKMVKGTWFIITPEEFKNNLEAFKYAKVQVRKANSAQVVVKEIPKLTLAQSIRCTEHAKTRLLQRFNIKPEDAEAFFEEKFNDHFIVQNFHFYNGHYKDNDASALVVCSRDLKTIFVVAPEGKKYALITCYNPLDEKYSAFKNWFNDHIDEMHEMPNLNDYNAA